MQRWPKLGQCMALPPGGTVGGALSVGQSGIRRLGYGPVRDVLLQACYVSDRGQVVQAGGPTVKNVSGFDLCRLLVGARGTLGFVGDVILRTRPLPAHSQWFTAEADDPFPIFTRLYRPTSVLWNGSRLWVLLEGHPADVSAQAAGVLADAGRRPARAAHGQPQGGLPVGDRFHRRPVRRRGRCRHRPPRGAAAGNRRSRIVSDETRRSDQGRVRSQVDGSIPVSSSPELPFVAAPPGTIESVTLSARLAAEHWRYPAPELLRIGMNAIFTAGDGVLLRVGQPTAPAWQAIWLADLLDRRGLRVPRYRARRAVHHTRTRRVRGCRRGRLRARRLARSRGDGRPPPPHRSPRDRRRLSTSVLRRLPVVELRRAARATSAASSTPLALTAIESAIERDLPLLNDQRDDRAGRLSRRCASRQRHPVEQRTRVARLGSCVPWSGCMGSRPADDMDGALGWRSRRSTSGSPRDMGRRCAATRSPRRSPSCAWSRPR